jgi:hypothetical protein
MFFQFTKEGLYGKSFVVRFAPKDSERPVYLLQEQQSCHRVGKRHL